MANKITIKNVKELLESNVSFLIGRLYSKTKSSFTARDANFILKSVAMIISRYFYKQKQNNNKLDSIIDKTTIETDSDDSNDCITVATSNGLDNLESKEKLPNNISVDIEKLEAILHRISSVGDPRNVYSSLISLVNGDVDNDVKYKLLGPIANSLVRIELRRSPLIANILASLHTLINEPITSVDQVQSLQAFIDKLWNEPISDDLHGVSNSCLKSFSVQLGEKLFYKIYKHNEVEFASCASQLCQRYISKEGDVLEWFISLKTIPNSSFRGPLDTNSNQESLVSFIILDSSYLSKQESELTMPLVYSNKARGTMAMHSALAIIKSCTDLKDNILYKNCILKLITWAIDEFLTHGYRITSLKGTSWQPIEIQNALDMWNENNLSALLANMID